MAHVLLHSLLFAPDRVSTAYLMTDLALDLKALGHSVTVVTTTPHYNVDPSAADRQLPVRRWLGAVYYGERDGIPVWHVKVPMKGTRYLARVLDYLRFHIVSLLLGVSRKLARPDIVIATSPPLTIGLVGSMLAARWRVPAVYKVAELYPDLAIEQGVIRHPATIAAVKFLERMVYATNTMIVPIAEQFRDALLARGVPTDKLCLIPDCVDTDLYRPLPRRNAFAEAHGLVDPFVVLYAGNIGLMQDWHSVLHAAAAMSHLPVTFVVVGDGSRRAWLAAEVAQRNLRNVRLFAYQPKEVMPEVMASCDVTLIPMTRTGARGGFPSKIYTIMACGKAVVASAADDSGMAALIASAGCGRVVAPEDPAGLTDALLQAYRDRSCLPAEGARGRVFVEDNYARRPIAQQYDALIRRLTASATSCSIGDANR